MTPLSVEKFRIEFQEAEHPIMIFIKPIAQDNAVITVLGVHRQGVLQDALVQGVHHQDAHRVAVLPEVAEAEDDEVVVAEDDENIIKITLI